MDREKPREKSKKMIPTRARVPREQKGTESVHARTMKRTVTPGDGDGGEGEVGREQDARPSNRLRFPNPRDDRVKQRGTGSQAAWSITVVESGPGSAVGEDRKSGQGATEKPPCEGGLKKGNFGLAATETPAGKLIRSGPHPLT